MRKNLLLMLMAVLLPCLAVAQNNALQKTLPSSYYSYTDYRLVVPASTAGLTLPQEEGASYAVAQWIKTTSNNASYGGVLMDFGTNDHLNFNGNWNLARTAAGKLKIGGHGDNNHGIGAATNIDCSFPHNEWNYVLFQYNNPTKTFELYLNGEKVWDKVLDYEAYYPWADGEFHFGGFGIAAAIDEVHVFNRALSADEVKQAYTNPAKIEGLTGYYTLNEEQGTGIFANEAANAAEGTDATWTQYKGSDYWGDGVVNSVSNTPASANLVEGREIAAAPTTYSVYVPQTAELPGLQTIGIFNTTSGYQQLLAGNTYDLEEGTSIRVLAVAETGSGITALAINGTEYAFVSGILQQDLTVTEDITAQSYEVIKPAPTSFSFTFPDASTIEGLKSFSFIDMDDNMLTAGQTYTLAPGSELMFEVRPEEGYDFNGMTINGEDVEMAKSGSQYFGMYEVNADVTAESFVFDLTKPEPVIEYCTPSGQTTNNDRYLKSITVNGKKFDAQPAAKSDVYYDYTSEVITVEPGETLEFSSEGAGTWMCTFIYGDFDKNGWNVDEDQVGPNGDLLWYNLMWKLSDATDQALYNMDGKRITGDGGYNGSSGRSCSVGGVKASITVPEDLTTGDYRMRYKVDWASNNPCGCTRQAGQNINTYGGCMIDFILHVEAAPRVDHTVSVAIAEGYGETGTVELVGYDATTVTNDETNYTAKATPVAGAKFMGWYDEDDNLLSSNTEYSFKALGADAVNLYARFGWIVTYSSTEGGRIDVTYLNDDYDEVTLRSGDPIKQGTTVYVEARPADGYRFESLTCTGSEAVDYGSMFTIDVTAMTDIQAKFVSKGAAINTTDYKGTMTYHLAGIEETYENVTMTLGELADGTYTLLSSEVAGERFSYENLTLNGTKLSGVDNSFTWEYMSWGEPKLEGTVTDSELKFTLNGLVEEEWEASISFNSGLGAIGVVGVDGIDADAEYFTVQGVRVAAENLTPGFYIVRKGNTVSKVYFCK